MTTQDHTAALLPCPFCGGKALLTEKKHYSLVNCGNINCDMDAGCKAQRTQDAIAAWNTRAQPQQPAGWKLVPVEPTPNILAAASLAAWPTASPADIELARQAARIVLMHMDQAPCATLESVACAIATMAPAYRAMLAAAPAHPSQQEDMSAYKRMFEAAVRDLAAICEHLGLDPDDDGGADPIIYAIDELRGSQQEDDARDADEDEPERFVVLKASGSRYAYVNDTLLGKTVKRYDILRGDGWADAKRHAERLNRDAAMSAAQGDAAQGGGNAA